MGLFDGAIPLEGVAMIILGIIGLVGARRRAKRWHTQSPSLRKMRRHF